MCVCACVCVCIHENGQQACVCVCVSVSVCVHGVCTVLLQVLLTHTHTHTHTCKPTHTHTRTRTQVPKLVDWYMCVCGVAHVDIGKRAHVCAYGPAAVAAVPVRHFKLLLKYDAGQAPIRFSVPCDSRYLLLAIFIVLLVFVSARTCTCTQK